jgi:hypothetical protein
MQKRDEICDALNSLVKLWRDIRGTSTDSPVGGIETWGADGTAERIVADSVRDAGKGRKFIYIISEFGPDVWLEVATDLWDNAPILNICMGGPGGQLYPEFMRRADELLAQLGFQKRKTRDLDI